MSYTHFTLVWAALAVGLPLIVGLLRWATGIDLASPGLSIVPVMGAAMLQGQRFVRRSGRLPDRAEKWAFARRATAIVIALGSLLAALLLPTLPQTRAALTDPGPLSIIAGMLALFALAVFAVSAIFLMFGARGALKAQARKDRDHIGAGR